MIKLNMNNIHDMYNIHKGNTDECMCSNCGSLTDFVLVVYVCCEEHIKGFPKMFCFVCKECLQGAIKAIDIREKEIE